MYSILLFFKYIYKSFKKSFKKVVDFILKMIYTLTRYKKGRLLNEVKIITLIGILRDLKNGTLKKIKLMEEKMTKLQLKRVKRNMDALNKERVEKDIKNRDFDFMVDMIYLTKGLSRSEWNWEDIETLLK